MRGRHGHRSLRGDGRAPFRVRFLSMPYQYTLAIAYWFAFCATVVFAGGYTWHSWQSYEKDGHSRLALTTTMIAVATRNTLDGQASRLGFLAQQLWRQGALTHPRLARTILMEYKKVSPDIVSVEMIAPNGQVIASTAVAAGHPLPNFHDDPHIWPGLHQALRSHGLHIHRPLWGPLVNHWVIRLSRTIFTRAGKPLFLVTTPIRFRSFEGLLAHIPLRSGLAIGVLRDDFYIEGREPIPHGDLRALIEKPQTGILTRTLHAHPTLHHGSFDGWVSTDHRYRFGAFVRIPGYPLVAFADIPRGLWLDAWWRKYIEIPLVFLVAALAFSGVAYGRVQTLARRWEQEKDHQKTVLHNLVTHDPLTGLLNRKGLYPVLRRTLERAIRDTRLLVVGFLDVDDFKLINDRYGHPVGDAVLRELAARLKGALRGTDRVVRLGGDEFVLLIEGLHKVSDLDRVIEQIDLMLAPAFVVGDQSFPVYVSLGLTIYPFDDVSADGLLHHADQAMYAAKARSPGVHEGWVQVYDVHLPTVIGDEEGGVEPPPNERA
ncbi:MAG: diguanylate cyclase domain-containing protein [Acidiferrobacter sp.]